MKNTLLILLILITGIFIGGWFVLSSPQIKASLIDSLDSALSNIGVNNKNTEKATEKNYPDSDNDGLPDWQETTIGTNPLSSDTDNDRYLDGEEFYSGYDPLIAAPNDKKDILELLQNTENLSKRAPILDTGKDPEKIAETVNMMNIPLELIKVRKEDFNVVKDSPLVLERYTNSYQNIIDKNFSDPTLVQDMEKEVDLIINSIKNKDSSKIKILANGYRMSYNDLMTIEVPEFMADIHKDLLEYLLKLSIILNQMETLSTDTLRSAINFDYYRDSMIAGVSLQMRLIERMYEFQKQFKTE